MLSKVDILRAFLRDNPEAIKAFNEVFANLRVDDGNADTNDVLAVLCSGGAHVKGSVQRRCECNSIVWLSPSTQKMLEKRGAAPYRLLCPHCLEKEIKIT
jgi:hypothetical protein